MKRTMIFAKRNTKEILRDPLSIGFCFLLPILLLLLMVTINKNTHVEIFSLEKLIPGMSVFSLSFVSLFAGILISQDRTTSFLTRLHASPMKAINFIMGYTIPLIILGLFQSIACFSIALLLGMKFSFNVILAIIIIIIPIFLFIGFGILIGTCFSEKQVGGVGSILIQIASLSSGMWFDLEYVGKVIETICYSMPFAHSVNMVRYALSGEYSKLWLPLLIVFIYSIVIYTLSIIIFNKKMSADNL